MNKKLATLFSGNYGMEITKNLAYGKINGYEVNAVVSSVYGGYGFPLTMHVSFYATDEQKRKIESDVRNCAFKFFKSSLNQYGISFGLNDMTLGKLVKRLPELLDKIFGILTENGCLNAEFCPVCGNRLDQSTSQKRDIDGFKITIDNECVEVINKVISAENEDFKNAPNNYLKGFLGALIGGLVGVGISVAFYAAGFISSISAIVSIFLGAFLYQKFHGKPNKMMIVIVSLTTIVLSAATIPAIYIVGSGIAASDAGLSMSAMEAFKLLMTDAEFSQAFYGDLAMILLFSAIGTVLMVLVLRQQIKRKKNI